MMEFLRELPHALGHTVLDTLPLLPFLYLTYLLLEYLEHRASARVRGAVERSGAYGPLLGGVVGAVPQCGFSSMAASLYAGGAITAGTLLSVFLSTSDEMLPVMLAGRFPILLVLRILLIKVVLAVAIGFAADGVLRLCGRERYCRKPAADTSEAHASCHHCHGNIWLSALRHTLEVAAFVLLISFVLHIVLEFVGDARLSSFMSSVPLLAEAAAALIGMIPNCASSIVITRLYMEGVLGGGAMLSGLLAGSGVGTLILLRTAPRRRAVSLLVLLYAVSVLIGLLFSVTGLDKILL